MKICTKCKEELPLESFHKHKGFKDGHRSVCAKCSCENSQKYYKNNREKHMDICRDWQRKNRSKVLKYQKDFKERQKQSSREWIKNNPNKDKAHKSLNHAVYKGEITRLDKCQVCGCTGGNLQAHHHDYKKPLEVIWLCTSCHGWIHRKRSTQKTTKVLSK